MSCRWVFGVVMLCVIMCRWFVGTCGNVIVGSSAAPRLLGLNAVHIYRHRVSIECSFVSCVKAVGEQEMYQGRM